MNNPQNPVSWQEIAATYDARSLPFMRYFLEAGLVQQQQRQRAQIFCQKLLPRL